MRDEFENKNEAKIREKSTPGNKRELGNHTKASPWEHREDLRGG